MNDCCQKEGGYDPLRFVSKLDEDLLCPICTCVLRDPVFLECEHMFCKKCLILWVRNESECPVCRLLINPDNCLRRPPRIIANLFSKMELKCSVACSSVFTLDVIDKHEEECAKVINCPVEGCEATGIKMVEISLHLHSHASEEIYSAVKGLISENERLRKSENDKAAVAIKLIRDVEKLTQGKADLIAAMSRMKSECDTLKRKLSTKEIEHNIMSWHKWNYEKPVIPDFLLQKQFLDYAEAGDLNSVKAVACTNRVNLDCINSRKAKTALHEACCNRNEDMAILLLQCGADPDVVTRKGGVTSVHIAAREGLTRLLDLMLTVFGSKSVNAICSGGDTPLHWASRYGRAEAVHVLLKRGAHAGVRNSTNQTALEVAGGKNRPSCVLLEIAESAI